MVAEKKRGVGKRNKKIMEMYTNIETSVKVEYTRSEPFDVKVGVYLGSTLTPLLFEKIKEVSNVICGKSISLKVRGTLYKSYVRSALTYGAECLALKVEDERKLKTTEMRILRMMCGKTLKDKINNDKIRGMTVVERLEEFLS